MDSVEIVLNEINKTINLWIEAFASNLPNMLVALVIIAMFYVLSSFVSKWIVKLLDKSSIVHASLKLLLASFIKIIIVVAGVFFALGVVGLDKTVVSLMAGVGVIGLALGFAFKDLASNLISGLFIAIQNPFDIGDYIKINNISGTVSMIRLRDTILTADNGQKIYIPNKSFMEDPLFNYSQTKEKRLDMTVGISYEDNLSEALAILKSEIPKLQGLKKDKQILVQTREFGLYSVLVDIKLWIDVPGPDSAELTNEAMSLIKDTLEKRGFHIPRPYVGDNNRMPAPELRQ